MMNLHDESRKGGKLDRISYTPNESAIVTGRSRTRIFKAIKDRELLARKDGRATLIEESELRRWVKALPTIGRGGTVAA